MDQTTAKKLRTELEQLPDINIAKVYHSGSYKIYEDEPEYSPQEHSYFEVEIWCEDNFLSPQSLQLMSDYNAFLENCVKQKGRFRTYSKNQTE